MADCITHAMRYRKNIVEEKDVAELFSATMKEAVEKSKAAGKNKGKGAAAGAIVFASADPNGIEFGLVNDYGLEGWDIKRDTRVLLSFMDPVGVVALGAGLDEKRACFVRLKARSGHRSMLLQSLSKHIIRCLCTRLSAENRWLR